MKLWLLKACSAELAQVEGKYQVPGLHVFFAKKEHTALLNGLISGGGQRGIMEGKTYNAVDTLVPFVASVIDSNSGSAERCDLTGMNLFYTDIISKLLCNHSKVVWMAVELASLQSEILKIEHVIESTVEPHCSSGLLSLKLHLLDSVLGDLERSGSSSFKGAVPLKHFSMLICQFYRMKDRLYSTRLFQTVHNLSTALDSMKRGKSEVHHGPVRAS